MSAPSGGKSKNPRSLAASPSLRAEVPFLGHDGQSWSLRPLAGNESNANMTRTSFVTESLDNAAQSCIDDTGSDIYTSTTANIMDWASPHAAAHSASRRPPTPRDIPPVTLTAIHIIEPSVFKDYLRHTEPLFDDLQPAKLEIKDGGARGLRRDTSIAKDQELAPAPLSSIPSVYFNENFRPENPRVFNVVSEHTDIIRPPPTARSLKKGTNGTVANDNLHAARKALTTNAILQEKLSWYMDTVEIHLICSISQASNSFSAALGSLRVLLAELSDSVTKVHKLRDVLAYLDQEILGRGSQIIGMKQRQYNLRKLSEATKQLQYVLSGISHCEQLADSGQLETATQHLSFVEQLASGMLDTKVGGDLHWLLPNPFIRLTDLRRLHVLRAPLQRINQLRQQIRKGYESRLLNILLCDLRRHVSAVPPKDTLARWAGAANPVRGVTDAEKLREELIPVLQRLDQPQYLNAASTIIREAVIREMKSFIHKHLPMPANNNDSIVSASMRASDRRVTQQENSSILSPTLSALDSKEAEAFLVAAYCGTIEAARRLSVQIKVLLDITSSISKASCSPSMGSNSQEGVSQALDMSSLLLQAVDTAQSEIIKVLRVRAEQTIRFELTDFLRYLTLNRLLVSECEAVSGHPGTTLKDFVNNQIHNFIQLLHEMEKQKLVRKMESEKWERIDFNPQDALILAHIVQSMTTDPPAWLACTDAIIAGLESGQGNSQTILTFAETTTPSKQSRGDPSLAVIEEDKFILVASTAFVLHGIEKYMLLLASIPSIADEISTFLLDYLKQYNSCTQQLILGAGAKITAGLTNINTKHLSLASQSLSFFVALIPYVRECVRRRPSITASGVAQYDRLKRLFQDHQSSLHDKLIDIMKFRANLNIREMEKIRWDDEDEVQRSASPHMKTLIKEALTLQRVLNKYLPALTVRTILGRVFANYKEQWGGAFERAALRTQAGKARLFRDAELLEAELNNVDGAEELCMHLINIAKAKQILPQPEHGRIAPSGEGMSM